MTFTVPLMASASGCDWDYNDHYWMVSATVVSVAPPTVSIAAGVSAAEGGANGTFVFTRTGSTAAALTVNTMAFSGGSGTATPGADYTAANTATFAAGSSTATLVIQAFDDTLVEGTETVGLYVTGGTGYEVNMMGYAANIALSDNDSGGAVTITTSGDITEGDAAPGWFNIHRTDASAALALDYWMPYGSATAGLDYTGSNLVSGTMHFAVGQYDVTLSVQALED